jgi:hypothetical protein
MKWRPDPRAEFVCWGLAGLIAFIVTGLLGWDSFLQGPDSNLQPAVARVLLMILGGVVWFGLGVLLTMAMTWFRSVRERSRARKLAAVASALGLKHSLQPLPYFRRYRSFDILLTHTDRDSHLQNHLYGIFKSQPVDVVDLEYYIQRGNATGTYRQTLFIFPAGDQKLPVFRIQPQTST